jgi:hypothetical protein
MADVSLLQTGLVSLGVGLVGGYFLHFWSGRRDRDAKRRDLVTKYLIEIWQTVESITKSEQENSLKPLEKAVADIQLFGSKEHIRLAKQIADSVVKTDKADTTDFLNALQSSLRNDLGLPAAGHGFFWFRSSQKSSVNRVVKRKNKK